MSRGELQATIFCEDCGGPTHVYNSRGADKNKAVRRHRECLVCKKRFKTIEKIERTPSARANWTGAIHAGRRT